MSDATDHAGPVCKDIPDQWLSGMGKLVKVNGYPTTAISYHDGQTGPDKVTDRIATIETTLGCQPLLTIPLPGVSVPGVNAPVTFAVSSERTMENPDYAQPGAVASVSAASQSLSRGGWDGNNLSITGSGTLIVF